MPELPEVEAVRRGLARARLSGVRLRGLWRSESLLRTGAYWRDERLHHLQGATSQRFARRGKFLLWEFSAPDSPPLGLVVHLGMTGRLVVEPQGQVRPPHTHLVFDLEGDREVHYVDARRFGGVRAGVLAELLSTPPIGNLGPEPLAAGFDGPALQARGGRSKRAIRDVLLDQRVVAGLGNIYVSEALFDARIHPLTPAVRLRPGTWERLATSVVEVLRQGVRNGGTSFRDYRGATGKKGRNQDALLVYGREGQECPGCGRALTRYVHSGRSGVLCSSCQPRRAR